MSVGQAVGGGAHFGFARDGLNLFAVAGACKSQANFRLLRMFGRSRFSLILRRLLDGESGRALAIMNRELLRAVVGVEAAAVGIGFDAIEGALNCLAQRLMRSAW